MKRCATLLCAKTNRRIILKCQIILSLMCLPIWNSWVSTLNMSVWYWIFFNFNILSPTEKKKQCEYHSRLAELDQVLVCGPRMEAADIQVSFTQLFPPDAVAATVGTGGRHLVAGRHIGLLQQERNRFSGLCINTQMRTYFIFLNTSSKLWTSKAMFVIISCVKNSKKRLEMMRDRGWSCMRVIILWDLRKMISYSPHVNTHQ